MTDPVINWLLTNQIIAWLLVAFFCLLFEMGSPGLFFFLSFFFGALMAAAATFVTTSWLTQSVVFTAGTACSFLLLHYWVKRRSKLFDTHTHTNIYAMRNKKGRVTKEVGPNKMGRVKIEGETWSARPLKGQIIEVGKMVEVVQVKGAHVVVQEVKEK